ncbi:ead/Ea22-like family protein [Klebsiella variicola]|uniref:ead/Ea22-like family protein n=1 Tax=Klebsiella variicola TaxID=244366 RepID=UPI001B82B11C|nr:ead/Ea22-like family protein [Klebsiella variicola]MBR7597078.1 ead/Ea22-like family protein [Klebsiella variicola]
MTTDITELAQSLKAAAEKATPGEWVYFPKNTSIEYDVGSDESQGSILYVDSGDFTQVQTDRNGEFIALANPANVLALVEALELKEEQRANWSQMAQKLGEDLDAAEKRIAELESRTVTVKLPDIMPPEAAPAHYWGSAESMAYADGYNKSAADLKTSFALSCSSAGVNVEFE